MKKRVLSVLLLSVCNAFMFGCGEENPTPDNPVEVITGVTVSGPSFIFIGDSTQLSADVLGSEEDSVTWSSSDTNVATVSETGLVTGVREGQVTITATSTKDTSFSGTLVLTIRSRSSESIKLIIEENDDMIINDDGSYEVPAGQTFKVRYELDNASSRVPDSVAFSFTSLDGSTTDSSSYGTITYEGDGSASITTNSVFEDAILLVRATYGSTIDGALTDYVQISSFDINKENNERFEGILSQIAAKEQESLVSARYMSTSGGVTSTTDFSIYSNATYGETTVDESVTERTYSSLDETNDAYYYFTYNADKTIDEVYVNENYSSSSEDAYRNQTSIPHFMVSGIAYYGFSSLINDAGTSGTYRGYTALGAFSARAYADYTFTDTSVVIKSEYTTTLNDIDTTNKLELNLEFNSDYELKSYSYSFEQLNDKGEYEMFVNESGSDFVYGTKSSDSSYGGRINLNDYYITDFDVISIGGNPDYGYVGETYLYDSYDSSTETYTVRYNHSLALMATNITPTTGTTLVDTISASTTYEYNGNSYTRDLVVYDNGICAFSSPRNENGELFETTEVVTFTSRGGASFTVNVNWVVSSLEAINIDIYGVESTSRAFPDIRVGGKSNYFYINPDPADTSLEFAMRVTSGDASGIVLKQYTSENIGGYPGFSYYIEGVKEGTYSVEFYAIGVERVVSETYTITVNAPISKETYVENLVGNTFVYGGLSTGNVNLEFVSETLMTLTLGDVTETVNITMADGGVTVNGTRQSFQNDSFYFDSILGVDDDPNNQYDQNVKLDNIIISEDFATVRLPLRVRDNDASYTETSEYATYQYFDFNKFGVDDGIVGKTFTSTTSYCSTLRANLSATITFDNSTNGMIYVNGTDDYLWYSFTYVIEDGQITLSSVTSSSGNPLSYREFYLYSASTNTYRLRLQASGNYTETINLDFVIR